MAKQYKINLDYFPLDCIDNDGMRLVQAKHGIEGFAVIIKILQRIYGTNGYYCDWSEDARILFASQIQKRIAFVDDVVGEALRRGIFNEDLYDRHEILTSREIQSIYFEAVSRRGKADIKRHYLLLNTDELPQNACIDGVNVYRNKNNADIIPENDDKSSQIKRKEIKGNKIKENEIIIPSLKGRKTKPSFDEVVEYAIRNRFTTVNVEKFYLYFIERGKKYDTWQRIMGDCASGIEGGFSL